MGDVEKLVTNWLIEEGYEVKKLPQIPQVKFTWGLDVFTPPPLRVNIKLFKPEDRNDRVILLLGVGVSPEHQAAISRLPREGRLKFSSKLLSRLIQACATCSIAIQPNPIEPQGISVALTVFDAEITEDFKPRLMEKMTVMINAFLLIVSTFNEEFPVIPKGGEGSITTRM
ncbi:MAG: DUF2299 family protein [Desulfurococcales archaeon]|nr:DUF2299 family protein [Desulfurococcales archaeon]